MAVYYLNEFFIKNVIVDQGNRNIVVEVIFPKITVKHFLFHQVILSMDYSISSGLITLKGFFQVGNHKEYQNVVIISFVHLEKINIFCFMH